MAAVAPFHASRRMTRAEYAKRRDETTASELDKLYASPEFRSRFGDAHHHCKRSSSFLPPTAAAILAVVALGAAIAWGNPSAMTNIISSAGKTQTSSPTPAAVAAAAAALESCRADAAGLRATISNMDKRLRHSIAEFDAVQKAAAQASREVGVTRKALAACQQASAAESSLSSSPSRLASMAMHMGANPYLYASFFVVAIAAMGSVAASLMRRLGSLSADLEEHRFRLETSEQSVNILEMELQRKMKQLEEAKRSMEASAAAATAAAARADRSPKIMAGRPNSQEQPGEMMKTPGHTASGSRIFPPSSSPGGVGSDGAAAAAAGAAGMNVNGSSPLPPPPQQLVYRYLKERSAIAVEEAQMKKWVKMEKEYAQLKHHATTMQAEIETLKARIASYEKLDSQKANLPAIESNELRENLRQLNVALAEHRDHARKAKEALAAVRTTGAGERVGLSASVGAASPVGSSASSGAVSINGVGGAASSSATSTYQRGGGQGRAAKPAAPRA